jgi:hypothetical protein
MAAILIEEIQSFIYQYNLRGLPLPSATSLLGLPGLRPSGRLGLRKERLQLEDSPPSLPQFGLLQDDLRLHESGLWELVTLQQKVVLQLLDRYQYLLRIE